MHRQVTVVAILMIVQGALEIFTGGIFAAMGPVMMSIMSSTPHGPAPPGGPAPEDVMAGVSIYYMLAGLLALGAGIFQIIAGIRSLKFRGRTMGIVAVSMNVLALGTCYCVPTAIGVMVYGLIVYLNAQTARAFALGEQGGMTADDIKATVDAEMRGGYAAAGPQYPGQQYPGQQYPGQQPPPPPYGSPGQGGQGGQGGPGAPPGYGPPPTGGLGGPPGF